MKANPKKKEEKRLYDKKRYLKESEKIRKQQRKYNKTKKGKETKKRSLKNEWLKNPQKMKARQKLNDRIKRHKNEKQPCSICGNPKSEAHHKDYSKPLEVNWLCRKHHKKEHDKLKNEELLTNKKYLEIHKTINNDNRK